MKIKNEYLAVIAVALLLFFGGFIKLPGATGGAVAAVCPTILAQTLTNATYDYTKPTTAANSIMTVYLDAANGVPYPGGASTKQLGTYDVLLTSSTNFFGILKTGVTTDCSSTPTVSGYLKAVDTPSVTVYNTDGVTANTNANSITIGASSSGTAHLKFSQGAAYKFLTGETGKYCVFFNASAIANFSASESSAVFDGVPCTKYTGVQPSALTGVMITGWECQGVDFAANDGSIHDLAVKIQAASGTNPTTQNVSIVYGGADYFKNSINGKVSVGCVTDTGAVIQTLRTAIVEIA